MAFLSVAQNFIIWWVNLSMEYPFIAISPRPTQTWFRVPLEGPLDLFKNYSWDLKMLKKQVHKKCKYELIMKAVSQDLGIKNFVMCC